MSTRIFTLLALLIFLSTANFAQVKGVCGIQPEHHELLVPRLRANINSVANGADIRSGNDCILPLVYHIINKADGTGGIPITRIYDQNCNLNQFYIDQGVGIRFMIKEINIINHDVAFSNHFSGTGTSIFNQNKRAGSINIFIPEDADADNGLGGTVLGYYNIPRDWLVMRPSEVSGFSSTLHHELGHYFSLEHPFYGWDQEAYDSEEHGVQVGNLSPGGLLNEKQDGSNCTIAADLLCDTPPDYNFFSENWGCNYTGGAKDPNGTLVDPDETNIMSYFNSCTSKTFSPQQIEVINADITARINQGSLQLPNQTYPGDVAATTGLIEPINQEVVPNNANIFFDWPDIENAEEYYLEIDWVPSFSLDPIRVTVDLSEYYLDGSNLLTNKLYYWRVRAFNDYDHCSDWSDNGQFMSSVVNSVKTLDQITAAQVVPNPATPGDELILSVNSQSAFMGNLQVFNVNGQLVTNFGRKEFQQGNNSLVLGSQDWPAGIYFLQLSSTEGVFQTKLIVQ